MTSQQPADLLTTLLARGRHVWERDVDGVTQLAHGIVVDPMELAVLAKPADQGRGVGEVTIAMVLASMRNWAGVADRCSVTEGHAPSCIRIWADQLEAAIAALTQPKGDDIEIAEAALERALAKFIERQHVDPSTGYGEYNDRDEEYHADLVSALDGVKVLHDIPPDRRYEDFDHD